MGGGARVPLAAYDEVDSKCGEGQQEEENNCDESGDKLSCSLCLGLVGLCNSEGIDEGVGEEEKWFHRVREMSWFVCVSMVAALGD